MAAIFGPASPYTRGIVASIAARYDIPHIDFVWRENEGSPEERNLSPMTINVFPDSEMISQVCSHIKKKKFVEQIEVTTDVVYFGVFAGFDPD